MGTSPARRYCCVGRLRLIVASGSRGRSGRGSKRSGRTVSSSWTSCLRTKRKWALENALVG